MSNPEDIQKAERLIAKTIAKLEAELLRAGGISPALTAELLAEGVRRELVKRCGPENAARMHIANLITTTEETGGPAHAVRALRQLADTIERTPQARAPGN